MFGSVAPKPIISIERKSYTFIRLSSRIPPYKLETFLELDSRLSLANLTPMKERFGEFKKTKLSFNEATFTYKGLREFINRVTHRLIETVTL